MPNLASLLKSEISRLARKEVRAEIESLKKSATQYRSDIAALKRQVRELDRRLRANQRSGGGRAAAEAGDAAEESTRMRFSAKGLAAHRQRLGLSAQAMGQLIGVTGQTIYSWEAGKSRPRASQMAAVAAARALGRRAALAQLEAAG